MAERLLILLGVGLALVLAWLLVIAWSRWRVRRLGQQRPFAALVPSGRPAVIAFSSPSCGECRTRQAPAMRQMEQEFGHVVSVRTLSAPAHAALTRQLGILTVPSTAIVDGDGRLRHLNVGYAPVEQLRRQALALVTP